MPVPARGPRWPVTPVLGMQGGPAVGRPGGPWLAMRTGDLEQVVGVGRGRRSGLDHRIVAGALAFDALRTDREPGERVEPMHGQGQVGDGLPGAVAALDRA